MTGILVYFLCILKIIRSYDLKVKQTDINLNNQLFRNNYINPDKRLVDGKFTNNRYIFTYLLFNDCV